jgi:hypothetical protein
MLDRTGLQYEWPLFPKPRFPIDVSTYAAVCTVAAVGTVSCWQAK